jgi:hypothetical protein
MALTRRDILDFIQGKFGKRKTDYPNATLDFPVVTENHGASKRADGGNSDFLITHPDFPNTDLVLTEQATDIGNDNDKNRTTLYKTVPGPLLFGIDGTSPNRYGHIIRFVSTSRKVNTEQKVRAKGTITAWVANPGVGYLVPPTVSFAGGGGTGAAATASLTINSSGQVWLITMTNGGAGFTSAPTVTLTAAGGDPGTGATALAFLAQEPPKGYWVFESKTDPSVNTLTQTGDKSVLTWEQTVSYVDAYDVLVTHNAEDEEVWAGATTLTEKIVPLGTTPATVTFPVLSSKVEAIDRFRALSTAMSVDAGGWPTLTEFHVDSQSGIIIRIHKQMVDAAVVSAIALNAAPGTNEGAGAGINNVYAPGLVVVSGVSATQIEHQPHDEYRTIQLISDIGQLPSDEQYPDVVQMSLPDILNSAQVNEAWATDGDGQANSAALQRNVTKGYTGPANATVYRKYFFGPPSGADIPDVTAFFPEEDSLYWYWYYFTSDQYGAEARTFEFPATLHDAITVTIGGSTSGAGVVGTLAATCPIGWAQGQTLVHAAKVEKQQMGIYLIEYVKATIPVC